MPPARLCLCVAFAALSLGAAAAAAPEWKLRYTENFDGKSLNPRLWSRIIGNADFGPDWQRNISPRPDLVEVKDGVLILKGVLNDDKADDPRRVLAGGVTTLGLFNMLYGKLEFRVKLEGQKGAWPAIWLMPQHPVGTWPLCGEIDVIERLNHDPFVYQTVHSAWTQSHPNDPPQMRKGAIKPNSWNIFAVEWTPDRIIWRVNGKQTHSYSKADDSQERWPWNVPFYVMIDMQLGGKWVGPIDETTLPVAMHVDWVKFYQLSIDGKRISAFTRPLYERNIPRIVDTL